MILICVLSTIILSLPAVQTRFANFATNSINKEFGTNINIDKLKVSLISWNTSLTNVYIEDYERDTLFYVSELTTSILNVRNLVNGKLEFGDIAIDKLDFKLKTYKDSTATNLEIFIDKLDDGKPRKPGTPPFFFSSSNVEIANSTFKLYDENRETVEQLNFKNLNISAEDFQILGPEVTTDIKAMSFNSHRGLQVDKLSTDFKYTKQQMRFDSLGIKTPESELKGNLVFNYDRKDFKDFLNKVNIQADFTESTVAFDEINKLYNQFGTGKKVTFASSINGVLNDLNAENLFAQSDNTGIRGDFNFKSLFSKEQPFVMDAKMKNVTTSYYELRALLPNFLGTLPTTFQKLGQFTVRGDVVVSETAIDAKVNLNTSVGSSYTDIELTNINDIDNAEYKGFVSLIDFDLGRFTERKSLGKTTFDFNVEGKGITQENLNTEVIGQVYSVDFNNYTYKNIKVSGIVKDQLFDGNLSADDENLKFNFKGLAEFGSGSNNFNFIANVDYADLKKLNFINDSISIFKGNVNMDISGSSLDNIAGDIKFTKTNFQNKNDTYYFEDFKVSSTFAPDSIRTIEINSTDIITGYLKGNFKVQELGKLVQNSLGTVYTNYRPFEISEGQTLAFNFKIYNKIVDVFFPEVKFDPNTFIKGNIVADDGDFKLNFKSPSISAFGTQADEIEMKVDNKNPLFNTYVSVGDLSTPYYDVKDFNLINTTLKDTLFFRSEFRGGSEYDDSYNLNFYHTFNQQNKSVIGLKTSDVSFKGNTWVLNKEGDTKNKVIINRTLDSISIQEIVMNNDEEEQIRLRGQLADSTFKDLQLQFKIVSLDKIAPVIDSLNLGGEVNGTLNVFQKDGIYLPSSNLGIDDFSINDIRLGDLTMGIVGNKDLTDYVVNTQITDNGIEKLGIVGNISNRGDVPTAQLLANFRDFELEPFSPLGEGIIDNIRGDLNGSVRINGELNNPEINGLLTLNNAGIAVPYLNVDYSFAPNSRVRLENQTFDFEQVALTDVDERTRATIDGTIKHSFFKDWLLDLNVNTNNDRLLILNTAYDEEELYYGKGFLNGTGRIFGPTKALTIKVDGRTARGTSLNIPLSDVASLGDYSFINFIDKKNRVVFDEQRVLNEVEGLELEFDLVVTPEAEVSIVTDVKTGSTLKGTGEGIILMRINTRGRFDMFGDFVVVTGEYNYKFGGLIDKKFKVKPGGTIVWEQDPLAALLNMEAVYNLNANPGALLDDQNYSRAISTDVVIELTGELENPTIGFDIEFPGSNSIVQSELEYRLQDPALEEKNAIFLLAQGSFFNDNGGLNGQAITGNITQSVTSMLNQLLSSGDDKFKLGIDWEQSQQATLNTDATTNSRLGVTVSTQLSDRVLINGKVGVPVGGTSETIVAGDVEVQLLLNEQGTLSAKFFSRQGDVQEYLADQLGSTQGVGLSYEVDFDNFKELWQKVFKKEKEKVEVKEKIINEPVKPKKEPISVMGNDSLVRIYTKTKGLR
ncbi:MAG: translocation/assembly module TamB domain-containing protein [Maribacter sp.]